MSIIAISLGGSTIMREGSVNTSFLRQFAQMVKEKSKDTKFIIVTGGGYISKLYVDAANDFTKSNYIKDELAIAATKLNAAMVASVFGISEIAKSVNEIRERLYNEDVVVSAGMMPGFTTDTITMLAAEACDCSTVINVSRSGGIYETQNPKVKNPKIARELSHDALLKYAIEKDTRVARSNFIFDAIASRIAQRSNVTLHFVGEKVIDIQKAIENQPHSGTVVFD
jgi:uridylate kinase